MTKLRNDMRALLCAIIAPAIAGALVAQAPLAAQPARSATPLLQTVTFDIASAFQQHYRALMEPLVFGRFSVGISGEYTTEPDAGTTIYAPYSYPPPVASCPFSGPCGGDIQFGDSHYRAWSFDLHARWYPGALSYRAERQSAAIYVGEFIGYHERKTSQQVIYSGCPTCGGRPDSAMFMLPPDVYPGSTSGFRQVLRGWEPGVEFGVRVLPLSHVVMDVGGRFRLARIDDPQSTIRPGGVDARLVVALGVGW